MLYKVVRFDHDSDLFSVNTIPYAHMTTPNILDHFEFY